MKKCILSLTLVLCMLVSILPATSLVSAADSAVKYTYDFTTNAIASTYDIATLNSEVAAAKNDYTVKYTVLNAFAATPTVDTAKTTGWSVANTRYVCNATENGGTYSELTSDGFRFLLFTGRYFDEAAKNSYFGTDSWKAGMCTHVAFVINIPVAGIYDLNMFNNVAHTYGAHTEVRFGKTTKTTLSNADVTDLYNAADTVVLGWHDSSTVHDGSASNPAETFTITASEPGYYFIIFGTPNGTLAKNSNRISLEDAEVTTGGGVQSLNLSKITLAEHVVKLSLEASISNSIIEVDETAQITTKASLTNGNATNGVVYTYTPKDSSVVSIDNNGAVTGLKPGDTEITVKAVLGDKSDEKTLSVKVIEKLPDTVTLTYDFNQVNGETSNNLVYSEADTAYANTNGTWAYAGINAIAVKTQSAYGAYINMTKSVPYSAIKLNIPYAGSYSAKLIHHKNKTSGGKSDIFLIPSDADVSSLAAITANKNKIPLFDGLDFNNSAENLIDVESEPSNIRIPEGGEYYLVFHCTELTGATYGAFPHMLILEGVNKTDSAVMYFEPTVSVLEVEEQKSTDIALSGWMTDGSLLSDDVEFTYTPKDSDIVSVDKNGTVTGLKKGETEITIKSVCGELTLEKSVSVTVTEKLPDTVTLTYDFNEVNGETSNDLIYSEADTAYANTNGTWAYAGINAVSINTKSSHGANIYMSKSLPYAAIKLNIPYAGSYSAKLIHHKNKTSGGKSDIFLIPADADVSSLAAITANKNKIPLFEGLNFNNPEAHLIDVETEPSNIRIPEGGEYYLVFHITELTATHAAYPHKLILEGVNKTDSAVMYFDASISEKEIKKGETAEISTRGWMTDGTPISKNVEVSYVPEVENIVSVDASGKVTGLADGRTNINVSFSHAGLTLSKKVKIIVDSDVKTGYKIIYNLGDVAGKCVNTKPEFATHTYDASNDFWKYLSNSANQTGVDWAFGYVNTGFRIAQNRWMAFEIEVPVAGIYSMYMEHGENKNGCDVGVYVSPADATDSVISDNYKIGSYNCDNDAVETNFATYKAEPSYVSNVTFPTPGKYRVAFRTPQGSDYSVVGNIILDGGDGLLLMHADMDISKGGKVELSGILSDGSAADFSEATVKLSSSDTDVVEAPSSGYALGLKSLGTTTITAEIEYGVSKLIISKEYTVTKLPVPFSGADTEYIFYQRSEDWDTTIKPVPGFEPSDRIEDVRGITYKYTGVGGEGNWQYNSTGPNWIPKKYQIFMYSGDGTSATNYLRIQCPADGDWVALDIKVPAAGRYVAEYSYSAFSSSASKSDIFILPKNETTDTAEEITALLTDERVIASVDYLDASIAANEMRIAKLGDLEFPQAGEYILIHKRNDGGRGGYLSPRKLTLYGVNGMCDAEIIVDKTTLNYNETAKVAVSALRLDGSVVMPDDYTVTLTSSDSSIVAVSKDGTITAKGDGKAIVSVTVVDNAGKTVTAEVEITAIDNTGIKEAVLEVLSPVYVGQKTGTSLNVIMNSGNVVAVPSEAIQYSYNTDGIASIDVSGKLSGIAVGTVEITAAAEYKGEQVSAKAIVEVVLDDRKSEPTYYTYEMREAILENVRKYDWAKSNAKSEANYGDKYVEQAEFIYNILPGEGIPRTVRVGLKTDPEPYVCRYCDADLDGEYGGVGETSGFAVSIYNRPWKVQCPGCKRLFPSNDFGSFYELGRDRQGYFDVDRARQLHHEMLFHKDGTECLCEAPEEEFSEEWYEFYGYGNSEGYLYNELYAELYDPNGENYNKDPRTGEEIVGVRWGVDDGFGYKPGRMVSETCEEVHTYIANYNLELHDELIQAIVHLTRAYLFTGDIKYGRAGAIIIDRLADIYPSYDLEAIGGPNYANNDGGSGRGKTHGRISESQNGPHISLACDAFFPALTDPQVISFLSKEAENRGLENDKSTPEKIWDNWELGILDEIYYATQRRQLAGNFGMDQNALACVAIVRDREPLTSEIIEWIYATNTSNEPNKVTGGNLMSQLIDIVDRDGNNNESAPAYNGILVQNLYVVAQILANYTGNPEYNLYNNPKYVELFVGLIPTLATETKTLAIGDSFYAANTKAWGYLNYWNDTFDKMKDTEYGPKIANYLYMRNGFTTDGLNYGIYAKDPERLEKEILERIDPEYRQESTNMTGYGLAILRDGIKSKDATMQTEYNSLRDTWIYYGGGTSHKHLDTLEIGMDAFGIDIAPDLGEPEEKTQQPNRLQWVSTTISHNTVLVNEKEQDKISVAATPIHFDDSGIVKVIDVEAPEAYKETSEYRRTAVVVEADNDVAYTVDFFRVKGGTHHSYSFHSQAENAYPIEGLDFTTEWDEDGNYVTGAQVAKEDGEYMMSFWNDKNLFVTEPVFKKAGEYIGSYASPSLECGQDPNSPWTGSYQTVYPRGYSWMSNVRRDTGLESGKFTVEFDVKDYRKVSTSSDGVKLRMTQINDFVPSEVVITAGYVPQKTDNREMPKTLDYVLVNRESSSGALDTLYTTVFEPYKNNPYIASVDACDISTSEHVSDGTAKAVKVTHTSGRVDYIVFAVDNSVIYTVTDGDYSFDFRGAIGVLSRNGDEADSSVIYRYVNDGDIIGEATNAPSRYSGTVKGFNRELSFDNYIDVDMECDDLEALTKQYIYVNNDGVRNGVFEIEGASKNADGTIRLDIGTTSLIRGHKDKNDVSGGYIYDIAENQKFIIPMPFEDENAPEVEAVGTVSATAGSALSVAIQATSPVEGETLKYIGTSLPRGAKIDEATGVFTWKPTSSQVGNNHIAITVKDGSGRERVVHFTVTVYGSTTGGGGGSTSPVPSIPVVPDEEDTTDKTDKEDTTTPTTPSVPSTDADSDIRFIDLGNHAWAADAINSLADDGVVRGTTHNTYSPGNNITRADFAILLVRAFELTSDDTTNFDDVLDTDYFASELAIARNTGIVNGIGDNKYAPRNPITRQDMMVIVYRALTKLGVELEIADVEYEDFADVADYAKDAVKALITAGLVNGKSGKIAPTDYTTRAEVAVLIKRILDYIK